MTRLIRDPGVLSVNPVTQRCRMPVKQYRCVVSALAIRTQPRLGDQFKIQQQIKLNDVIRLNDDSRTEAAGYAWLQHDRRWSAERTLDGRNIFLLRARLPPQEQLAALTNQ